MAIDILIAEFLFDEARRKPFTGSLLQLGRQNIQLDCRQMVKIIKKKKFKK